MKKTLLILLISIFSSQFAFAVTHHKKTVKHKSTTTHKSRTHHFNYMEGTASYYGYHDGFNGRMMADGDIFKANDVYDAAHPTLPLGTKLMVTNLRNGRQICVEVTDRMPKEGRVIDLSVAAAKSLGMFHRGLAHVKLQVISDEEFEAKKHYLSVDEDDNGAPG